MGLDGPRNYVLGWVQIPPLEGAIRGKGAPVVKYRAVCRELCKKAEPIAMPFGMLSGDSVA